MIKNYKYLMILIFILNFTNIYSQSNNYAYTWYNESIGTLYIDKQLLESTANTLSQYFSTLSQYLGPLEPIILKILPYLIENLPILVSFFALFFMSRRFINAFKSQAPESEKLITSLVISLPLTFFFWPFVIPILIIAFIIKVFRIGKSKLESFKETLGKISPRLPSFFSRIISDVKDFDKDTDKILKDIDKLYKILNHPQIRGLLDSIEKNIETLNNIISNLLKETENKELTRDTLKDYSSNFDNTYNKAKNEVEQLNRIINNMLSNYSLLRRFGNRIFRTNKFTPKYLMELRNILNDLNVRLNTTYKKGQKTFAYLNGLLTFIEAVNRKSETKIINNLKEISNNNALLSLVNNKTLIKQIQNLSNIIAAVDKNQNISPLKKEEILSETDKSTKKLFESLRKFKRNPKKLLYLTNKLSRSISKSIASSYRAFKTFKRK
ncbi:MAG: hypothetical protein RXQ68_02810 [Candidatus Nanopusillus sp.]